MHRPPGADCPVRSRSRRHECKVVISSIEPKRRAAYQVVDNLLMAKGRMFTGCLNRVNP
jgi:hypothetical protein